jgi:anaerobic magnesium-protoporphyrin IX monomethyl ester cyclase
MRIALVFPPEWDPTRPNNNLPMIQAVLKQRGFTDVGLLDANVRAYWHLLDPTRLARSASAIRPRIEELNGKPSLTSEEAEEYGDLVQASVSASYCIEHIAEALCILRDWDRFGDLESYRWAAALLNRAMRLATAPHYPLTLLYDDRFHLADITLAQVEEAVRRKSNLFAEFFEQDVIPRLVEGGCEHLVMSLPTRAQLIPALTLSHLLKQAMPRVHVTLTGVVFSYNADIVSRWPGLFDFVDTVVPGARQYSGASVDAIIVAELAEAMRRGAPMSGIPGVLSRDRRSGEVRLAALDVDSIRMDELPTPDFEGLAEEKYFAPATIWPLTLSRGCYWRRCTFCTRLDPYVERGAEKVVQDIAALAERWGAKYFYFPDDGIRPELFVAVSEKLIERKLDVRWFCMAHPNKRLDGEALALMHRAGCRLLEFGIESAAPRVLKAMNKGTTRSLVREVLEGCRAAGINARGFIIAGFPTESPEEARQTLDFVLENKHLLNSVRAMRFVLERQSIIASNPAAFGISRLAMGPGRPLAMNMYYEVAHGAGMQEAVAIWAQAHQELDEAYRGNVAFHIFRTHSFLQTERHGSRFLDREVVQPVRSSPSAAELLQSRLEAGVDLAEADGSLGLPPFRYRLEEIKERRIEWLIQREVRKRASILDGPGAEGGGREALLPSPKPVRYAYAGEADSVCEIPDGLLRFVRMIGPERTLHELIAERGTKNPQRIVEIVRALLKSGILRRCGDLGPALIPTRGGATGSP